MTVSKFLSSTALVCATMIGVPAWAQTPPSEPEPATEAADPTTLGQTEVELQSGQDVDENDAIVVTGSRIRSPNLTSSVPITSIGIQDLTSTGDVSLGDTLNELPALRSTFSQANSTRFIGTAGLNLLDLRGLGTARTLVLVNGRRHITAQPGNNNVDVNTIPTDLVERVDIVTGGNSAIYGSDAVAGVVNFILKRDFEGIRVRGQGGISSKGDRGSYFVSLTAGENFADDRGNVAIAFEYAKQRPLFFTDRDSQTGAFSGRNQFNAVENVGPNANPSAGLIRGSEPSTGNGIPDTAFLRGVRNNTISEGGLFTAACPVAAATGESAANFTARRALACSGLPNIGSTNALAQFGRTFVFAEDGSLNANPCVTDLRPFGSGNCVGGLGSTLRQTGLLQAGLDRYAANFIGSFEISPALRPFIEAKYVRVDSLQEGQATFQNNTFSINNPFLSAQARGTLLSVLAPGTTTFTAQRFNVDFGGRGEEHKRETYRVVAGVTGTFNDDWSYEISGNYGRLETFYRTNGNILTGRFANARDAVRNPTTGQIVCSINNDAITTNDDAACVPINLFGNNAPSRAALDYIGVDSTREQQAEQYNALAFVSGDLSQLFELPGGPVGFALGAEYRREKAFSAFDPVTQSGATFLNIVPTFDPPDYEIKEAFAEVRLPILSDLPFAQELRLDLAGRVSDYNLGNTGTVYAYNINATYAPVRDLRFRGGYARSVRAPTLSDLFASSSQTFLNGLVDPCGQQNINNNPNRVRNCAAAGVPTTQTFGGISEPFTNRPASGIAGFNRGNPELQEEKGRSITIGAVFQPRFVPGLSLTVDYYDIEIDNVIFSLGGQTIIDQCYDNPSGIENPFCAVVFRNANGTFAGQTNVNNGGVTVSFPATGDGASFFSQPFNFAKQETRGIDFDLAYRRKIFGNTDLNFRAIASRTIRRNNFTDITDPTFRDRQLSELGDPKWAAQSTVNLDFGAFDFQYQFRYIQGTTIAGDFETQNAFDGRPARNPDAFPRIYYPDIYYHDFRIGFESTNKFKFYAGVDNAFNRLPPFDLLGTAGGDPYDNVGRFFYAGAEFTF